MDILTKKLRALQIARTAALKAINETFDALELEARRESKAPPANLRHPSS